MVFDLEEYEESRRFKLTTATLGEIEIGPVDSDADDLAEVKKRLRAVESVGSRDAAVVLLTIAGRVLARAGDEKAMPRRLNMQEAASLTDEELEIFAREFVERNGDWLFRDLENSKVTVRQEGDEQVHVIITPQAVLQKNDSESSVEYLNRVLAEYMARERRRAEKQLKSLGIDRRPLREMAGLSPEVYRLMTDHSAQSAFKQHSVGIAVERLKEIGQLNSTGMRDMLEGIRGSHNEAISKLFHPAQVRLNLPKELFETRLRLPDELINSRGFLSDYVRSFRDQLTDLEKVFGPYRELIGRFNEEGRRWNEIVQSLQGSALKGFNRNAVQASLAWGAAGEGFADKLRDLGLFSSHPLLSGRLMEPWFEYSRFAGGTIDRLARAEGEEAAALEGSLTLAEEQIVETAAFVEEAVVTPPEGADETPAQPLIFNIFAEQQNDLLTAGGIPEGAQSALLITLSRSAAMSQKARRCVTLVLQCNKANKLRGGKDIFKTTTRFTEACANLSHTVARDQETLTLFVENMYFILYEGAGKDNLRFITEGFVSSSECDSVMAIKFLRNKWLSHDPDHGSEGSIGKTWRSLREALGWLGITRLPVSPDEYTELQARLLELVERFLLLLVERVGEADLEGGKA
jgi:hypothetical protein